MKTLEIRRHSLKQGGGSRLSQEGVDLARHLGSSLGPFAYVATSVVPRARETAIAMGFAVNQELVTLADEDVYEEMKGVPWWKLPQPFAALAAVMAAKSATWRYGHGLVSVWRDLLTALPDETSALVIGHSGELETALPFFRTRTTRRGESRSVLSRAHA